MLFRLAPLLPLCFPSLRFLHHLPFFLSPLSPSQPSPTSASSHLFFFFLPPSLPPSLSLSIYLFFSVLYCNYLYLCSYIFCNCYSLCFLLPPANAYARNALVLLEPLGACCCILYFVSFSSHSLCPSRAHRHILRRTSLPHTIHAALVRDLANQCMVLIAVFSLSRVFLCFLINEGRRGIRLFFLLRIFCFCFPHFHLLPLFPSSSRSLPPSLFLSFPPSLLFPPPPSAATSTPFVVDIANIPLTPSCTFSGTNRAYPHTKRACWLLHLQPPLADDQ